MESCGICLNTYTKKLRQKVLCQYCPEHACKGCQQNYLLSTYDDPHCFTCKRGWSSDFMTANFPLSFRNYTLRIHRRKILLEREKAMLPAMQIYVEARRNQQRVNEVHRKISDEICVKFAELQKRRQELQIYTRDTYGPLTIEKTQGKISAEETPAKWQVYKAALQHHRELYKAERTYYTEEYIPLRNRLNDAITEGSYWWSIYTHGAANGGEKVKREFLMRCPADECRGFLSTAYKCGTCEKHTCSECLEVLGLADDTSLEALKAAHTCNPDNVESAKVIKKETRPCPKCGARIFKYEGCDQVWCTVETCHTPFSWNTGQVVTGRIHNPHYYEWLRRNGGDAPREIGDIPCGGIPNAGIFARHLLRSPRGAYLRTDEINKLLEIHRNILDFEARLGAYPARPDALQNKDLNVHYLMNSITEDAWKMKLEHAEAAFNRKKEIGQLLQTFVTGSADILQGIVGRMEDPSITQTTMVAFIREVAMPQLEALRAYTNESFQKMSVERHMAVPLISDKWKWEAARALYKRGPPPLEPNEIIDEGAVLKQNRQALDTDEEQTVAA